MKKLFLPLILAGLILAACSPTSRVAPTFTPDPMRPTPNAAELVLSDPSKPIQVTAGQEFTITVRTNITPGLHWELAEALDPKLVAYVWKNHVPDDFSNPNSGGRDVWRFLALAPGKAMITLGYYEGQTLNYTQMTTFTIEVK